MQCHLTRGITRHTESHHLSKKCHRTPSDCNFCRSACSSFRGSTISSSSCSLHCVTRLLSVWMPACCNSGGSQPRPPLRSTASNCRAQACCRPPSTKVARESRSEGWRGGVPHVPAGACFFPPGPAACSDSPSLEMLLPFGDLFDDAASQQRPGTVCLSCMREVKRIDAAGGHDEQSRPSGVQSGSLPSGVLERACT